MINVIVQEHTLSWQYRTSRPWLLPLSITTQKRKLLLSDKNLSFPTDRFVCLFFFVHGPTDEQRDPLIKIPKLVKGTLFHRAMWLWPMQNKSTCLAHKFNLLKLNAKSKVKPEESGCNFCTTFFQGGGREAIRTLCLVVCIVVWIALIVLKVFRTISTILDDQGNYTKTYLLIHETSDLTRMCERKAIARITPLWIASVFFRVVISKVVLITWTNFEGLLQSRQPESLWISQATLKLTT